MTYTSRTTSQSGAGKLPVITMNVAGIKTRIVLAGKGAAFIDWGDDTQETILLNDESSFTFEEGSPFEITHIYKEPENNFKVTLEGNISFFSCSDGNVTAIDIRGNPALKLLDCRNTDITKLDIAQNPALICLFCSNTSISALDTGNNPALASLFCSNTSINALDMGNNPALESLSCSNTAIGALDMGKNPALYDLECYGTQMSRNAVKDLFVSLPDRGKKNAGVLNCGGSTACDDEIHPIAYGKKWHVLHHK